MFSIATITTIATITKSIIASQQDNMLILKKIII